MKKYICMYLSTDDFEKQSFKKKLQKAQVDFYFEDFSYLPIFDDFNNVLSFEKLENDGCSLWVLEGHYLVAFTILNYELLLKIDENGFEYDTEDVVNWYEKYKDNEMFVNVKEE